MDRNNNHIVFKNPFDVVKLAASILNSRNPDRNARMVIYADGPHLVYDRDIPDIICSPEEAAQLTGIKYVPNKEARHVYFMPLVRKNESR